MVKVFLGREEIPSPVSNEGAVVAPFFPHPPKAIGDEIMLSLVQKVNVRVNNGAFVVGAGLRNRLFHSMCD